MNDFINKKLAMLIKKSKNLNNYYINYTLNLKKKISFKLLKDPGKQFLLIT